MTSRLSHAPGEENGVNIGRNLLLALGHIFFSRFTFSFTPFSTSATTRLFQASPGAHLPAAWAGLGIFPVAGSLRALCVGVQSWHAGCPTGRELWLAFLMNTPPPATMCSDHGAQ